MQQRKSESHRGKDQLDCCFFFIIINLIILNLTRNSNLDDSFQIGKILISYLLNIYTFLYFNLI